MVEKFYLWVECRFQFKRLSVRALSQDREAGNRVV